MSRGIKIGLIVAGIVIVLPIVAIGVLFVGITVFNQDLSAVARREISLPNGGALIIDGARHGRSEHGFSQRAGYRPAGATETEWFGEVSDGVDPGFYQAGPLVVVIDFPSGCLFVRNPDHQEKWKTLALVFPNDLGPSFPVSYYAQQTGLTTEEVSQINQLGGKRQQKWPTTYIQNFDPRTSDLICDYHVDNKSAWPLRFRLSKDGSHLALVEIGRSKP
jgi:hypothetical protein